MTRRDFVPHLLFALLAGAWGVGVFASGRTMLPKHPIAAPAGAIGARPLPHAGADLAAADAEPFNWPMTDAVNLLRPDLEIAAEAFRAGRFPLWNPDVLCGVPHAANPITAVFYPPTWLVAFVPPRHAPLVFAAMHLAIAAALFFAWLRGLGLGRVAGVFGAASFALSGWMTGRLFNFVVVDVVVWLPLGLRGVDVVLGGRGKGGAFRIAAATALMFAAGFPQLAVLSVLALGIYAVVRLIRTRGDGFRPFVVRALTLLVAVGLGGLAALPLLLPASELRATSERGRGESVAQGAGLPTGALLGLVAPNVLGTPYDATATLPPDAADPNRAARHQAARLLIGTRGADGVATADSAPSLSELAIYPGAAVLLLAAAGLFDRRRRGEVLGLVAIGALGLLFALRILNPTPELAALLGLDVGGPIRGVMVFAFVPAALAAFAVDTFIASSKTRALSRWTALAVLPAVLLGATFAVASEFAYGATARGLSALGAARVLGLAESSVDPAAAVEALRPALDLLRADLTTFALAALGAAAALRIARRRARLGVALLFLVLGADLGLHFSKQVRPVRADDPFPASPATSFLRSNLDGGRIARIAATDAEALSDVHRLLPPNLGVVYGLSDVQGYREPASARTLDWFRGLSSHVATAGTAGFSLEAAASPALDLAGVKYFVAARPLEGDAGFEATGMRRAPLGEPAPGDLVVYENPNAFPRAFAIEAGVAPASRPSARPEPRPGATVERAGVGLPESAAWRVRADGPARLVWTEAFDRGWRVSIDGGPALSPDAAYGLFLSVAVPSGDHLVRFEYLPVGWRTLRRVAPVAALIVLLFAFGAPALMRRIRRPRPSLKAAP